MKPPKLSQRTYNYIVDTIELVTLVIERIDMEPFDGYCHPVTIRTPIVNADGKFYVFTMDGQIVTSPSDPMEAMLVCLTLYKDVIKLNIPYDQLELLCKSDLGAIPPSKHSSCAHVNTGRRK